jgi:uncharacterized protein (TIRG00374 family)
VNRNKKHLAVNLVLGAILLALLLVVTDLEELSDALGSASIGWLVIAFFVFSLQGLWEAFRLAIVFSGYGVRPISGLRLFFIGRFFSNFLPASLGADVYQVHQMHKVTSGLVRPISLSLYLRATGLALNALIVFIFLARGGLSQIPGGSPISWTPTISYIVAGMSAAVVLLVAIGVIRAAHGNADSRVLRASLRLVKAISASFQQLSFRDHTALLTLGLLVILVRALSLAALLMAFGFVTDLTNLLFVSSLATVASLVPVSFLGLGLADVTLAALLATFGVPVPIAVAVTLLTRAFAWILSLVGWVWNMKSNKTAKGFGEKEIEGEGAK